MTPQQRQDHCEQRRARLEESIRRLPAYAQRLVAKYRRHVELSGRVSPLGSTVGTLEEFVADVKSAFDQQWEQFKQSAPLGSVGYITQGSGA